MLDMMFFCLYIFYSMRVIRSSWGNIIYKLKRHEDPRFQQMIHARLQTVMLFGTTGLSDLES